jgi:hypothetical protein
MKPVTDRDGKSKTASAVDAEHYPEQNEVENKVDDHKPRGGKPTETETTSDNAGKKGSGSVQN